MILPRRKRRADALDNFCYAVQIVTLLCMLILATAP